MGRVLTWTLALCWALAVCFGLASPSSAATEQPESSPSSSPSSDSSSTGSEPEPTPEPELQDASPSASETPSPSPSPSQPQQVSLDSQSLSTLETMAEGDCGTPQLPCVVEATSDTSAWVALALGLLLVVCTAQLITTWGSRD